MNSNTQTIRTKEFLEYQAPQQGNRRARALFSPRVKALLVLSVLLCAGYYFNGKNTQKPTSTLEKDPGARAPIPEPPLDAPVIDIPISKQAEPAQKAPPSLSKIPHYKAPKSANPTELAVDKLIFKAQTIQYLKGVSLKSDFNSIYFACDSYVGNNYMKMTRKDVRTARRMNTLLEAYISHKREGRVNYFFNKLAKFIKKDEEKKERKTASGAQLRYWGEMRDFVRGNKKEMHERSIEAFNGKHKDFPIQENKSTVVGWLTHFEQARLAVPLDATDVQFIKAVHHVAKVWAAEPVPTVEESKLVL